MIIKRVMILQYRAPPPPPPPQNGSHHGSCANIRKLVKCKHQLLRLFSAQCFVFPLLSHSASTLCYFFSVLVIFSALDREIEWFSTNINVPFVFLFSSSSSFFTSHIASIIKCESAGEEETRVTFLRLQPIQPANLLPTAAQRCYY